MMERLRIPAVITAMTAVVLVAAACAANTRVGSYSRLLVTGDEIRQAGHASAYEALTNHRELIIFENRIGFKGGDDAAIRGYGDRAYIPRAHEYPTPLLVVNGSYNLDDAIITLRRIPAADIIAIRLYYNSMVPPEFRSQPDARGGMIEVTTR